MDIYNNKEIKTKTTSGYYDGVPELNQQDLKIDLGSNKKS